MSKIKKSFTVGQLIDALSKFDRDKPVANYYGSTGIKDVIIVKDVVFLVNTD